MPGVAADGRAAGGMRIDLAGILTIALGIDRQRTALGDVQALHIQGVTVAQDQADVTGDGFHAAVLGDVAVQIIPAAGHIAVGRHRLGGMGLIGGHDLRAVPAALHIPCDRVRIDQHGFSVIVQNNAIVLITAYKVCGSPFSVQSAGKHAGFIQYHLVTGILIQLARNAERRFVQAYEAFDSAAAQGDISIQ